MRDSTDDQSTSDPNGMGKVPPHPDDLRNVMLNRPRSQYVPVGTGDFSDESKAEDEPAWSDTARDSAGWNDQEWRGRLPDESQSEQEYQHPPFYDEYEEETDRGHPVDVARFGPPAGFLRRLVAFLVDNAITIVILSLLFPLLLGRPYLDIDAFAAEIESASQQDALPTATPVLGNDDGTVQVAEAQPDIAEAISYAEFFAGLLLALAVTIIYNGVLVGLFGTTVGKRLFNVYVLDENGNIPGIPLAVGRAMGSILSTAILYIGYLFILRDDNRALHDLMVGTYAITLMSEEQPSRDGEYEAE